MTYRPGVIGYTAQLMKPNNVAPLEIDPDFALNLDTIASEEAVDYSLPEIPKIDRSLEKKATSFAADYLNLNLSQDHSSESILIDASRLPKREHNRKKSLYRRAISYVSKKLTNARDAIGAVLLLSYTPDVYTQQMEFYPINLPAASSSGDATPHNITLDNIASNDEPFNEQILHAQPSFPDYKTQKNHYMNMQKVIKQNRDHYLDDIVSRGEMSQYIAREQKLKHGGVRYSYHQKKVNEFAKAYGISEKTAKKFLKEANLKTQQTQI